MGANGIKNIYLNKIIFKLNCVDKKNPKKRDKKKKKKKIEPNGARAPTASEEGIDPVGPASQVFFANCVQVSVYLPLYLY